MDYIRFIYLPVLVLFQVSIVLGQNSGFLSQQKKYPRVRTALAEKEAVIKMKLESLQIHNTNINIYIRIFKMERILQLWVKKTTVDTFALLANYDFCTSSGDLGPKRHQGDLQIPEGFYYIDRFNPGSIFYLSLGINYPNASDRIFNNANPGGDIFIHGNCVTLGCVPITDDKIKELYLYAVYAKNAGQKKIPVHIFPYRFNDQNSSRKVRQNASYSVYSEFWNNLKEGYDRFEKGHRLPKITIDKRDGKYLLSYNTNY
ncbi:MAG: hypothetical protein EH224_15735 [Calditrichaeota bacterium]|nr:MAG: hypothetical protein EH224_15735 [Calditrichota bacterium]